MSNDAKNPDQGKQLTNNPQGAIEHDAYVTSQKPNGNENFSDDEEEFIDPESTLYLTELAEVWANINLITQSSFEPVKTYN